MNNTHPSNLKVRRLTELPQIPQGEIGESVLYATANNKDYKVSTTTYVDAVVDVVQPEIEQVASTVAEDVATDVAVAEVQGLRDALVDVAFSGSYDDLIDKPTIPEVPVTSVAGKEGDVILSRADVGLGNVDNTSDLNKPISTATQNALDTKANSDDLADIATSGSFNDLEDVPSLVNSVAGRTGAVALTGADVGLGNVDNTTDLNKPISLAVQAALASKLGMAEALAVADDVSLANDMMVMGYLPPVPYTSGLNVDSTRFTVIRDGQVHAPAAPVPFTTGAWDAGQWRLIQGVTSADLASQYGSGMIGFKQSGAGAVLRTSEEKARERVSPYDFGAKGDGVADDTAAFVKLAAAFPSAQVKVDLAGGTYLIRSCNSIPLKDNISYQNGTFLVDALTTVVDPEGDNFGLFANGIFWKSDSTPFERNFEFENITFRIERSKVNAISGITSNEVMANTGDCILRNVTHKGYAAGNDVELAAVPGQSASEAGCLVNLSGYSWTLDGINTLDTSTALYLANSKYVRALSGRLLRCGVSGDRTKWHNNSGITVSGTYDVYIDPAFVVEETGGTAVFSSGINARVKRQLLWPTVRNAGLGGISSGVRSFATVPSEIEVIDISRGRVYGFLCAPGADLHSGISVSLNDAEGSSVDSVNLDGAYVDALASWESWDVATRSISGSLNSKKAIGGDVGSCAGVLLVSGEGTGMRIKSVDGEVTVRHAPVHGLLAAGVARMNVAGRLYRCGWRKNSSNAAPNVQQPLVLRDMDVAIFSFDVEDPCPGVNDNPDRCTPVVYRDVENGQGRLRVSGLTLQSYALMIQSTVDATGRTLRMLEFEPGPCVTRDAGHVLSWLSSSSASNMAGHSIYWPSPGSLSVITGYRTIRAGAGIIVSNVNFAGSEVLPPTANALDSVIRFVVPSSRAAMTLVPAAGDLIDGSGTSVVVSPGTSLSLVATPLGWVTV